MSGSPLRVLTDLPDAKDFRPDPLPLINVCNEKLVNDLRGLFPLCSSDEVQQFSDFLTVEGDLSKLVTRCGEDWEDGIPGRPAYLECKDKFGKVWHADFRFIEELPEDLWSLPEARAKAVFNHTHLSEQESKLVPRTIISGEGKAPPQSLRWRGARSMTHQQLFLRDKADSETVVQEFLDIFDVSASDALTVFRVAQLRKFLQDKDISTSGDKKVLTTKTFAYYLEHIRNKISDSSSDNDSTSDDTDSTSGEEIISGSINRRTRGGMRRTRKRRVLRDSSSDSSD